MKTRTDFGIHAAAAALGIFAGMLVFMELGRQIGLHELAREGTAARGAIGVIDGAIFALVSLLLGFSFNGAAARFDNRRSLVSNQVNAIGTAWQRIDLLPGSLQSDVRRPFVRYVDELLASYTAKTEPPDPLRVPERIAGAEADLWAATVAACLDAAGEKARVLLIPTVNEMLGAVEKERLARRIHPPRAIYAMLAVLTLTASLFGGYSMAATERNWLHLIGVAAAISMTVYVVLDLEFPRRGFIRISLMDDALAELRRTMKSG
jgi:hypothetical protein